MAVGWTLGIVTPGSDRRLRNSLVMASTIPDIDGLAVLGGLDAYETYHHTLAFLYSREEFAEQVRMHSEKMRQLFGQTPTVFRNTELIYNNDLAHYVATLDYKGIVCEGADHFLDSRSPNWLYHPLARSACRCCSRTIASAMTSRFVSQTATGPSGL